MIIKEDPYVNYTQKSRCDSCGKFKDRRILKRYTMNKGYVGIRFCPECNKEMFNVLGVQYDLQVTIQENIELEDEKIRLYSKHKLKKESYELLEWRYDELQSVFKSLRERFLKLQDYIDDKSK